MLILESKEEAVRVWREIQEESLQKDKVMAPEPPTGRKKNKHPTNQPLWKSTWLLRLRGWQAPQRTRINAVLPTR